MEKPAEECHLASQIRKVVEEWEADHTKQADNIGHQESKANRRRPGPVANV